MKLRKIKDLFLKRDYLGIFKDNELLSVYVAEYSPSRALCYWDMFTSSETLRDILSTKGSVIYSIGAGSGGELVGIAAALIGLPAIDMSKRKNKRVPVTKDGSKESWLLESKLSQVSLRDGDNGIVEATSNNGEEDGDEAELTLHLQDIADYSNILNTLESTIRETYSVDTPPQQESNTTTTTTLLPKSRLKITHTMPQDVLSKSTDDINQVTDKIKQSNLITAMFLTNELLSSSKKEFVELIKLLVMNMKRGACLLVVDSAGSFSEVTVGNDNQGGTGGGDSGTGAGGRKYMVYNLLDAIGAFEIVESSDSKWYRFPEGLSYPLKLNNM
ncbi:hypothetical protein HDU76_008902, partial [Blyttiomyces sp. JEL0837]